MRKTILRILFGTTFIVLLPVCALCFQNEPTGFRGIKWGTNINKLSDMVIGLEEGNQKVCKKINDKLQIGEANLKDIKYFFYKDKLQTVSITYRDFMNYERLKKTFFQLYGSGMQPNRFIEQYIWRGVNIGIIFKYSNISEEGSIHYFYMPLVREEQENEKKEAKDAVKDL